MNLRPAAAALLFGALACGGGGGTTTAGGGGGGGTTTCPLPTPIPAPRFSTDILPALQSSCGSATSTCHGLANPPGGHVRYDTANGRTVNDVYASLVNAVPANAPSGYVLVKPNDVAHSWIIEKVSSDQPGGLGFGARMPLSAPDLCEATVNNFKAWIQAGAPF